MGNNRGAIFILGAAVSAWLIYDMATAVEAPSRTLALMKYFLLGVVVVTTLYSGAKWFVNPPPPEPKGRPANRARARKGPARR